MSEARHPSSDLTNFELRNLKCKLFLLKQQIAIFLNNRLLYLKFKPIKICISKFEIRRPCGFTLPVQVFRWPKKIPASNLVFQAFEELIGTENKFIQFWQFFNFAKMALLNPCMKFGFFFRNMSQGPPNLGKYKKGIF